MEMMASKLTISQETRAKLDNPILTPQKRRELRQRLIVDRIRGTRGGWCTKQELIVAAGLNAGSKTMDYANGLALIRSMVNKGIISHNRTNEYRKKWTVLEDVKNLKRNNEEAKALFAPQVTPTPAEVADSVLPKAVVVALQDYNTVDKVKLIDMAKEFAWKENSDSLREFITYIENAIK